MCLHMHIYAHTHRHKDTDTHVCITMHDVCRHAYAHAHAHTHTHKHAPARTQAPRANLCSPHNVPDARTWPRGVAPRSHTFPPQGLWVSRRLMDGTARLSKTAACVYYGDECGPGPSGLCQSVTCALQKADAEAGRAAGRPCAETTQGRPSPRPGPEHRVAPLAFRERIEGHSE